MAQDVRNIYTLFIEAGLNVFETDPTPDFIKNHPILKSKKHINKVFPSFGLHNFRDKITYENKSTEEQNKLIHQLLNTLSDQIDTIIQNFNLVLSELPEETEPVILHIVSSYVTFLKHTKSAIYDANTVRKDGKTKILLSLNVGMGGKTILKTGDSVFQIFHKVNTLTQQLLKKYPHLKTDIYAGSEWELLLPNIDSLLTVKEFHNSNLTAKDYYIVFSSTGDTGAWDIATMSMRGIDSCQNWGNETYRECLIGSILSRYVGIIYLTSGSQADKHGEKMIRRCIVRFGINKNTGEKLIILDKMYDSYDSNISHLFIEALSKRTNIKVLNYSNVSEVDPEIPSAWDVKIPGESLLNRLKPNELPYLSDTPFTTKTKSQQTALENQFQSLDVVNHLDKTISDIYDQTSDNLKTLFKGGNSIISTNTLSILQHKIEDLSDKTGKSGVGYKLSLKYIKLKMIKLINTYYDLDIEKILTILFPHRARWSVERHLQELQTTIPEIRDTFEYTIREYKKSIEELLS